MEEQFAANRRVLCNYTDHQKTRINRHKQKFMLDLEDLIDDGKVELFENQEAIAYKIVAAFKNRCISNVMILAQTQSGKTGSMLATMKLYLQDSSNLIPIDNIYIITGLSSKDWVSQTKKRMPGIIDEDHILHRDNLSGFAEKVKDKQNLLIIIDEVQIAAKKSQSVRKAFQMAGFLDKEKLYSNDIKIIEYTATPDGTIYDLMKWKDASEKILAPCGHAYMSAYNLLEAGRVKQFKCLFLDEEMHDQNDEEEFAKMKKEILDNIQEIKDDVNNFAAARYHIIRTHKGEKQKYTIDLFHQFFGSDDYVYLKYDGESDIGDINDDLLNKAPVKHTFIFVKEMLRCAKTLTKKYLGVVYERHSNLINDSVIIQGLLGRCTGYDDNGDLICYTNIESIEKYQLLWESEFEDHDVKWISNTTKNAGGQLTSRGTFNEPPEDWESKSSSSDVTLPDIPREPEIQKFYGEEGQHEAIKYFEKNRKTLIARFKTLYPNSDKKSVNKPRLRKSNSNGFYETTIGKGKNKTRVYSCTEIYNVRKWNLDQEHWYTFHPCYEDTNDNSTLQFWLIYF